MEKNLILGLFFLDPLDPNFSHQIFFSNIWLLQSLDIMVSYQNAKYQKKLMIQCRENLRMDEQTGESDFIGHCPTDAERPTVCYEPRKQNWTPLPFYKTWSI